MDGCFTNQDYKPRRGGWGERASQQLLFKYLDEPNSLPTNVSHQNDIYAICIKTGFLGGS